MYALNAISKKPAKRKKTRVKTIIRSLIAIVLIGVIAYCAYMLYDYYSDVAAENAIHDQLIGFKPSLPSQLPTTAPDGSKPPYTNQGIVDLQKKHPDAVGWIEIPNTKIDYPFVQSAKDRKNGVGKNSEDEYLRKDINKDYLYAGTLFMDSRNERDLSDFNTIIYGHNMKSDSMFGTLRYFKQQSFFDTNKTGTIFTDHRVYTLEIFAFLECNDDDWVIYNPKIDNEKDRTAFLTHVKKLAKSHYRDIGVTNSDHLVTLSTCAYDFKGARMVLVGRLKAMI